MFNNLTINSGVTLTVPSGVVIQIAGNFVNNGTIVVLTGTPGTRWFGSADGGFPRVTGLAYGARQAYNSSEEFRRLKDFGPLGGSNGGLGSFVGTSTIGGAGGGTMIIKASGNITNTGTINALGGDGVDLSGSDTRPGVGGGGGGFLLFVANGNITNSGTVNVSGGAGGDAGGNSNSRGGAGGGGGLIHYVATNANSVAGTNTISGGVIGSDHGTADDNGGGEGGAGAGDGGKAVFGFPPPSSEAGSNGVLLRTQVADACAFMNN